MSNQDQANDVYNTATHSFSHTHTIPTTHTHTMAHTHTLASHTHSITSHTHTFPAHTHVSDAVHGGSPDDQLYARFFTKDGDNGKIG